MTRKRQLATVTGCDSIDSSNDRHMTAFDLTEENLNKLRKFAFTSPGEFSNVRAGTEGFVTGAGENDCSKLWLAVEPGEDVAKGKNHLTRKGVELCRAIEAND